MPYLYRSMLRGNELDDPKVGSVEHWRNTRESCRPNWAVVAPCGELLLLLLTTTTMTRTCVECGWSTRVTKILGLLLVHQGRGRSYRLRTSDIGQSVGCLSNPRAPCRVPTEPEKAIRPTQTMCPGYVVGDTPLGHSLTHSPRTSQAGTPPPTCAPAPRTEDLKVQHYTFTGRSLRGSDLREEVKNDVASLFEFAEQVFVSCRAPLSNGWSDHDIEPSARHVTTDRTSGGGLDIQRGESHSRPSSVSVATAPQPIQCSVVGMSHYVVCTCSNTATH